MSDDVSLFEARDPFLGRVMAGKYVIDAFLGAGAMGRVYRATQRPLDKVVAVKLLHANLGADANVLQRFLREAKAASRFDHPNSVAVFDFGIEPDGTAYIVMEYLRGESLDDLLQRESTLSAPRCVAIMSQVLAALSEAHDAGIVHRDMKPENIMLVSRGGEDVVGETVKVADFGIAKMLEDDDPRAAAKLTATGITPGSPAYMSPEQAQARPVDGRSDLYQCGVILYEMITGEIPFIADNAIGVIMMHINQPPPSARAHNPKCPEALDALIVRAMAKDPERRFSNARAMRQALKLIAPDQVATTGKVPLRSIPQMVVPRPSPALAETVAQGPAQTSVGRAAVAPSRPRISRGPVLVIAIGAAITLAFVVLERSPRPDPVGAPATVRRPVSAPVVDAGRAAPATQAFEVPPMVPPETPAVVAPAPTPVPAAEVENNPRAAGRNRANVGAHAIRNGRDPVVPPTPPTPVVVPEPPVVAPPVVAPPVVTPPVVAAVTPPVVAPTPVAPPAPTLRGVRGTVSSLEVTGGLTRGTVQGRATQAADALARCVLRAAESHGGAAAMGSASTVGVVVAVRDRRADDARVTGGNALARGCHDAVLNAFRGDLPQAEDTEYEIRMSIELAPQL